MPLFHIILTHGLITALLLMALILISLYINPRIWLQDLPKQVQMSIPPKTSKEKRQSLIVLALFLTILIAIPAIGVINYDSQPTLLQAWFITYSILFIFNLSDLLLIDWLIVCTITPSFIKIKGIDERVYKNRHKHLKDFLKGLVVIAVPSLLSCLIGYFMLNLQKF